MSDRIIGHYRILDQVGSGSMGIIYRAEQLSLARMVAMKVLPEQFTSDLSFVQRFENEVRAIAALDHPNIVQIYDFGHDGPTYYYTMEFIDGTSLDKMLLQRGALPTGRAIHIVARIAHALAYMHERGIIHRDIKPGNIMIDKLGTVKLMDFGLALYAKAQRVTVEGGIVGTPEYMSPEQASGETVTPLSDIYSLGVVLYELLTGDVPFEADTPLGVIKKIQTQKPVPPHAVNPKIPPGLEEIILKMMAPDPKKRYQDCHAVMADLKRFTSGESASLLSSAAFSKSRVTATVVAILLTLALVVGIVYLTASPRNEAALKKPERGRYLEMSKKLEELKKHGLIRRYARANKRIVASKPSGVAKPQSPPPEEVDPESRIADLRESLDSFEKELSAAESSIKGRGLPDMVVFKTGEQTKCQVVSESPSTIVIRTQMGMAEIPRSHIKSLEYDTSGAKKNIPMKQPDMGDPKEQISKLKDSFATLEKKLDAAESEFPNPQFPDAVVFKTGEETECALIFVTPDSVGVQTPLGMVEIPQAQIESIFRATPEEKENDLKLQSKLEGLRKQEYRLKSLLGGLEADAEETGGQGSDAHRELDQLNVPFTANEFINHVKAGDSYLVGLFLSAGIDVNAKDDLGKTALMYAADFGRADIVKALLDKSADPNVREAEGWTALMFAAAKGHGDIVQLLLDNRADVNVKDNNGRTALKLASAEGFDKIVKLLEKAGAKE